MSCRGRVADCRPRYSGTGGSDGKLDDRRPSAAERGVPAPGIRWPQPAHDAGDDEASTAPAHPAALPGLPCYLAGRSGARPPTGGLIVSRWGAPVAKGGQSLSHCGGRRVFQCRTAHDKPGWWSTGRLWRMDGPDGVSRCAGCPSLPHGHVSAGGGERSPQHARHVRRRDGPRDWHQGRVLQHVTQPP